MFVFILGIWIFVIWFIEIVIFFFGLFGFFGVGLFFFIVLFFLIILIEGGVGSFFLFGDIVLLILDLSGFFGFV